MRNLFNTVVNVCVALIVLGAIACILPMVPGEYSTVSKARLFVISMLQTKEEAAALPTLAIQLHSAELEINYLTSELSIAVSKNAVLASKVENAMVIEKDFSEIYDNRVKPKVERAGNFVKTKTSDAVEGVKSLYRTITRNE